MKSTPDALFKTGRVNDVKLQRCPSAGLDDMAAEIYSLTGNTAFWLKSTHWLEKLSYKLGIATTFSLSLSLSLSLPLCSLVLFLMVRMSSQNEMF